jgi:predicted nucleic acid-binding protein
LTIYADSSFFVSLHLVDRHSQEVWRRMAARPDVLLTPLNRAEFVHAVFLHVFWKKITPFEAERAVKVLDQNCAAGVWHLSNLPSETYARSIDLARQYTATLGVRTLDSLHVACALELGAQKFWTFDERQAKLAEAVGLDTNP